MKVLIDTTFSGKDITTAVSVYEYTIPADGMYSFQVRFAAVAGNGDYTVYLTLNDGDAQTDDVIAPKTTYTAASGETAFWFSTVKVPARENDVVNIFALGLAGDTSESGSIRIFAEHDIEATALTEAYASDGSAPTLAQAIFALQQFQQERAVSSTTLTVKKLDGSTTAMTFTLDDADAPTSITRAS